HRSIPDGVPARQQPDESLVLLAHADLVITPQSPPPGAGAGPRRRPEATTCRRPRLAATAPPLDFQPRTPRPAPTPLSCQLCPCSRSKLLVARLPGMDSRPRTARGSGRATRRTDGPQQGPADAYCHRAGAAAATQRAAPWNSASSARLAPRSPLALLPAG